jgi:predicted regulator of amino acid metabolism with ACT domain
MMTKSSKGIRDNNNIKLNVSYAIVGIVVIASFTAATALFLLHNTVPSFEYLAFAQEEGDETVADTTNTNTNTNTNVTNLTSSNTTKLVDFVSNIEQIRGHLEQAISNKQAGNNILVLAHTLHPIEEIYSNIEGQISDANSTLNQTLSSNLNQLSQMANNSTPDQFNMQVQKVNGLLNQTVEKVVPIENRNNDTVAFNLVIVADLLATAETEYKEAVENGTIKEIVEYQDAQGFVSRAQSIFEQTLPAMKPQELSGNIQNVKEFFSELNNTIDNKSNPEVINTSIRAIMHEISGITGIREESLLSSLN